jgi:hypothetical protein
MQLGFQVSFVLIKFRIPYLLVHPLNFIDYLVTMNIHLLSLIKAPILLFLYLILLIIFYQKLYQFSLILVILLLLYFLKFLIKVTKTYLAFL